VFIIFSIGVLAGTVTPTPGGVVGAEAGLAAALVAYGVPAASAIAIALLYRLVTYWLPMVPGFVVFLAIRKKYL
jgi:undecaprenyl-diphosphatase